MRLQLLQDLDAYQPLNEQDAGFKDQMLGFVRTEPMCFERSLLKGHITGSALIVDPLRRQILMLFHAKLEKWLQPGGHADGNSDVLEVAIREAEEETGLSGFRVLHQKPFDLDIHTIPARGQEPEHLHYDIRYLLEANPDWKLSRNSESKALKWVDISAIKSLTNEESILRMVGKLSAM